MEIELKYANSELGFIPFDLTAALRSTRRTRSSLHLTFDENIALADIVRELSNIQEVLWIILYGSKARGDWQEGSDIDLLVITSDNISEEKFQLIREINVDFNIDTLIDFSCKRSKLSDLVFYRDLYPLMLQTICEEGVLLYERKDIVVRETN